MISAVDNIIDRITMYRLVLYVLAAFMLAGLGLSAAGVLSFSPLALLYSTFVILVASWAANEACAKILNIPANTESVYITALILALIITPPAKGEYISSLTFLVGAAVIAEVSKYVLNIGKKHIFNPAALAVVVTSYAIGQSASWWIGTRWMLPVVAIGGLLVTRKVQRFQVLLVFAAVVAAEILALTLGTKNLGFLSKQLLLDSPLIFFATIMLTEPLTMPPTRSGQLAYAALAGWLFSPLTHFGSLYFSPELALCVCNVFSYAISPKGRHVMSLTYAKEVGKGIYEFAFTPDRPLVFAAGQYMEWTLGHKNPDSRGNRRYLTIASSPTEKEVLLGVRFYDGRSSYKQQLIASKPGHTLIAGQLAGDFTLPEDASKKLAFIAGGVGITPFRSMIKYLVDTDDKRSVVLLYANRREDEIAYRDIFDEAQNKGIRTVYTLTAKDVPQTWTGQRGHFTSEMFKQHIPDYHERLYYISGSHRMVEGAKQTLLTLGIPRSQIKIDFFPGLA